MTDTITNPEESPKEQPTCRDWWPYLIPVPTLIPILYVVGISYYEGKLRGYNIPADIYPQSFETTLVNGAIFLFSQFQGVIIFGLIVIPLFSAACFLNTTSETTPLEDLRTWANKRFPKIASFFQNCKSAISSGIIIVGVGYLFILGLMAVYLPFYLTENDHRKNFEAYKDYCHAPQSSENGSPAISTIAFKDKTLKPAKGVLVETSEKFLSIVQSTGTKTYSWSEVVSVHTNAN